MCRGSIFGCSSKPHPFFCAHTGNQQVFIQMTACVVTVRGGRASPSLSAYNENSLSLPSDCACSPPRF